MEAVRNNWPKTEVANRTLMFAQSMLEQFRYRTWDSFKVQSLDTCSVLTEAVKLAQQCEHGFKIDLTAVWEEVVARLKTDVVVKGMLGDSLSYLTNLLDSKNTSAVEKKNAAIYLLDQLGEQYKTKLESKIIESIGSKCSLNEIYLLSKSYGTLLINKNFSRLYIHNTTLNSFFLKHEIRKTGAPSLKSYFKSFSERNLYRVFFSVDSGLTQIINTSPFSIHDNTNKVPDDILNQRPSFFQNRYGTTTISTQMEAPDYDKARENAVKMLEFIYSLSKLTAHKCKLKNTSAVVARVMRPRGKQPKQSNIVLSKEDGSPDVIFISDKDELLGHVPFIRREPDHKQYADHVPAIMLGFTKASRIILINSLLARQAAIQSNNRASQILSLWSALEALPPRPQGIEVRLLAHVSENIVPSVGLQYFRKKIGNIYSNLVQQIPNFKALVTVNDSYDEITNFFAVLVGQDYEKQRQDITDSISGNPLIGARLTSLRNSLSTKKKVKEYYDQHIKRVEWQLARIYRARNEYAHGAREGITLEGLILNLDEYYRSTLESILQAAPERGKEPRHLEHVLMENRVRNNMVLDWLTNNARNVISIEDAERIIWWRVL